MIVGAIIKYTASNKCVSSPYAQVVNMSFIAENPPASIYLKLPKTLNSSELKEVKYNLWGEVSEDTSHCTGSLVRAVSLLWEYIHVDDAPNLNKKRLFNLDFSQLG